MSTRTSRRERGRVMAMACGYENITPSGALCVQYICLGNCKSLHVCFNNVHRY